MPQTPPALPPNSPSDRASRETARLVLQLNDAICAFRAGEATGIHALDSASGPMIELTDEEVMSETAHRTAHRHILQRPDRVELAILTALADTYGAQMLTHVELGYALRLVARYGGVAFAQRILWGESAADRQLAVMLTPARAAFAPIARAFPAAFLAEARAVIAANCPPMPRPPAAPSSTPGGEHE